MRFRAIVVATLVATGNAFAEEPKPLPAVRHPEANPSTPAKVALGRRLFFDKQLSLDRSTSCASCHDPKHGFADRRKRSLGVEGKPGTRHVPSLVNVGFANSLMWDGRADSLEHQVLLPIRNPVEMGLTLEEFGKRLTSDEYRKAFAGAFDAEPSVDRAARAISAFERTIVVRDTPFDRHLAGDATALGPSALRGLKLFFGDARCAKCHTGPTLSDGRFHNVGTVDADGADPGRFLVTKKQGDRGAFRTPQLREVGRTAPYMHDGRFDTLEEVVRHYNFGGVTDVENPNRDEALEVLYLDDDAVADLVAFLKHGLTRP